MDVKRLIEAASNNMLSELSRERQVYEMHGLDKCSKLDLVEIEMKEREGNPNNPFNM